MDGGPQYLDISIITDKSLVREIVKYEPKLYMHINRTLKQDTEFVKSLIQNDPSVSKWFNNMVAT